MDKGMVSYMMSVVVAIVVAVALVSILKKMFVSSILGIYENPKFQAKMISMGLNRMLFMPEGTRLYYTLPESRDCDIRIGNGIVFVNISGNYWYEPIFSTECNQTVPSIMRCDGSTIVFEKVNGSVVPHKQGDKLEVRRICP